MVYVFYPQTYKLPLYSLLDDDAIANLDMNGLYCAYTHAHSCYQLVKPNYPIHMANFWQVCFSPYIVICTYIPCMYVYIL